MGNADGWMPAASRTRSHSSWVQPRSDSRPQVVSVDPVSAGRRGAQVVGDDRGGVLLGRLKPLMKHSRVIAEGIKPGGRMTVGVATDGALHGSLTNLLLAWGWRVAKPAGRRNGRPPLPSDGGVLVGVLVRLSRPMAWRQPWLFQGGRCQECLLSL